MDANVLLNLYNYSPETREDFLRLLDELRDRIWLPYQVADEYHRNRCEAIAKESRQYTEIKGDLAKVLEALGERKRHPFISKSLFDEFTELTKQIETELATGKRTHEALVLDDPICQKISVLFDNRVGDPLPSDQLEQLYAEGKLRYDKKIPPGYKDSDKPEPNRYGDLVLWKEILVKSSQDEKPVIFITDDVKDDWWQKNGPSTIGPRPELRHEFTEKTGKELYIYTSSSFVDFANKRGKEISEKALSELRSAETTRRNKELIRQNDHIEGFIKSIIEKEEQTQKNTLAGFEAKKSLSQEQAKSLLAGFVAKEKALQEASRRASAGYLENEEAAKAFLEELARRTAKDEGPDASQ